MDKNQDSHVIYQEVLTHSLTKLLKMIPKQMISLKQLIEKSLDQINNIKLDEKRFDTNANKYFMIYKYCIDIKQKKITESCLYDLEKLISNNFLDGYSYDYIEYESQGKRGNRMLIDSIVDTLESCLKLEDISLHYLLLRCIDLLFKQSRLLLNGESLMKTIKIMLYIYKHGQINAKQCLINAINTVFEHTKLNPNMEIFSKKGEAWNHIYEDPKQIEEVNCSEIDIYEYVSLTMMNMVDDVVLYDERIKQAQINNQNIELIPLASVPQAWEADDLKYKNYIEVKIEDKGVISGKFGWCILCRQPAPFFCKDTRVPVCSVPCKKKHFEMIENIKIIQNRDKKNEQNEDCKYIFQFLIKKSQKEKSTKSEICFQIILHILENYPYHYTLINFDDQFISSICLGMKIHKKYITNILLSLIFHGRDQLQIQLEIILDYLITKSEGILLDFCTQLIETPKIVLELFTNHDCIIERRNIIQPLFEGVAKLGQQIENQQICQQANSIIQNLLLSLIQLKNQDQNIAGLHPELLEQENQDKLKQIIKNIEHFDLHEKQLSYKQTLQTGLQRFSMDWKEGLDYLIQHNLIEDHNLNHIAKFFQENQVNKQQLGQYFGSAKDENQQVFQIYTQSIEFKNKNIIDALRKYLSYFTLPGEAQQVDRCMLVFSQKYYEDNNQEGIFKNSDETYIFSYLLIILQTDIHSQSVKNKMTFEQFCKSSKLSMERDLGEEYLKYCYDQICLEPLAIHSSIEVYQPQNLITLERKSLQTHDYIFDPQIDYIKLFMEVFWPALHVNLVIVIERVDNLQILNIVKETIMHGLHLMSIMNVVDQCQQFIQWLCQLASLQNKQLKQKNYLALQCLVDLAIKNGNALKYNWVKVLELISSIDYILNSRNDLSKKIQTIVDMSSIDKIMQNTRNMDSRTILDFLQALIDVSLSEITLSEPRIFSLQRLVEVTSFNMDRIRLIWIQIWNLLKIHFVTVGIHEDQNISLYACDQLKQMSVKFIQLFEYNNYRFQMEFLQPFELIYAKTKSNEVREFILSCMRMLSHMCFYKLKSGWRILFHIVNQGLLEQINLVNISLEVLTKVFSEDLILIKDTFDEIEITFNYIFRREEQHVLLKGIEFVYNAIDSLMKHDSLQYYTFWMQSLAHLCNLFQNKHQQIQEEAIKQFFKVLKTNTTNIKHHQYVQIMRGMMKELFSSLGTATKNVCQMAHKSLLELVFDHDIKDAYNEIANILICSTSQSNEYLAKTSVISFKQIILKEGRKLDWNQTIQSLEQMVQNTTPQILFDAVDSGSDLIDDLLSLSLPKNKIQLNSDLLTLQCILQLMLIDIIQDIAENQINQLCQESFQHLKNITLKLYNESFKFNRQIKLRYFLQNQGFMTNLNQLPGLIKQEKSSAIAFINLLSKQFYKQQELFKELIHFIIDLFKDTKYLGNLIVNQQFKAELDGIIINNLNIIQLSIIPFLDRITSTDTQLIKPYILELLTHIIQLPPLYSLLPSQCPHCQICPYKCQQKIEWKKFGEQLQQLQLKLLQNIN